MSAPALGPGPGLGPGRASIGTAGARGTARGTWPRNPAPADLLAGGGEGVGGLRPGRRPALGVARVPLAELLEGEIAARDARAVATRLGDVEARPERANPEAEAAPRPPIRNSPASANAPPPPPRRRERSASLTTTPPARARVSRMRSRDAPPWIIRPTASCTASAVTPPAPAAAPRESRRGRSAVRGGGGGAAGSEAAAAAAADPDAPLFAAATASASAARSAAASAASSAASASSPARTSSGARFSTNAPESSSCASNRLDARCEPRSRESRVLRRGGIAGRRFLRAFPLASATASAIPLRTVASGTATLAQRRALPPPRRGFAEPRRGHHRRAELPGGTRTRITRARGGPPPVIPLAQASRHRLAQRPGRGGDDRHGIVRLERDERVVLELGVRPPTELAAAPQRLRLKKHAVVVLRNPVGVRVVRDAGFPERRATAFPRRVRVRVRVRARPASLRARESSPRESLRLLLDDAPRVVQVVVDDVVHVPPLLRRRQDDAAVPRTGARRIRIRARGRRRVGPDPSDGRRPSGRDRTRTRRAAAARAPSPLRR